MIKFYQLTSLLTLLLLSTTFAITGTVTTRNGSPIKNVTVHFSENGKTITTGNDGSFSTLETAVTTKLSTISNHIELNSHSISLSGMGEHENISFKILSLNGRVISEKSFVSNENGDISASLLAETKNISNGIYIISIVGESIDYQLKSVVSSNKFNSSTMEINAIDPQTFSRSSRSTNEIISFSHDDYQPLTVDVLSSDEEITIILDPYGPDKIPVLLPAVDGKLIVGNGADTLKVFSVMPPAGIQEWSEAVRGREPTGVSYDPDLTSSTTMKAEMRRAGMNHDQDWQISFATATIGKLPFNKLSHILIRYKVESDLDSIALSLNESGVNGVVSEYDNRGAYRAVLEKGVQNPGTFVTDTLTLDDFRIGWSMDQSQVGSSLADNKAELAKLSALAFTNELNPWDEQNGVPVNSGDTIDIVVAGILFGTLDSIPTDTTTTTGFPVHHNIIASTFWVGEGASGDNDFITNTVSAWDGEWGKKFGLEDAPLISRDANFIPSSNQYKGIENPFYCALPYNDMSNGVYDGAGVEDHTAPVDQYSRKLNAYEVVPWADEMSVDQWGFGNSMCKNRWIKIQVSGTDKVCYVQWQDAGPYYYNNHKYVFGTDRPANTTDAPYAAIDLSPSACLYLEQQLQVWGAPSFEVDWSFVNEEDVPDGPWKRNVTTGQINW